MDRNRSDWIYKAVGQEHTICRGYPKADRTESGCIGAGCGDSKLSQKVEKAGKKQK